MTSLRIQKEEGECVRESTVGHFGYFSVMTPLSVVVFEVVCSLCLAVKHRCVLGASWLAQSGEQRDSWPQGHESSPTVGIELTFKKCVLDRAARTIVLQCLQDPQSHVKALLLIRQHVNNRFRLDGFVLTWLCNMPASGLFWQVNRSDWELCEAWYRLSVEHPQPREHAVLVRASELCRADAARPPRQGKVLLSHSGQHSDPKGTSELSTNHTQRK